MSSNAKDANTKFLIAGAVAVAVAVGLYFMLKPKVKTWYFYL
jgi:hypothetical protein